MTLFLAPLLVTLAQLSTTPVGLPPPRPAIATSRRGGRLFISPMGEPFRPSGRDDNTLADWFAQADRDHDGRLLIEEMQQDAQRFFALLDVNHDGEIDPEDINRYENVVAPEIQSGSSYSAEDDAGFIRADKDMHQGAGRFGLLDLPEPVISADGDFNRGVSLTEFRRAAQQRFLALDLDHHGYLTLAGLESTRPAPPPSRKELSRRPTGDESDTPSRH